MYVPWVYVCTHMGTHAQGSQRRLSDPLELNPQVTGGCEPSDVGAGNPTQAPLPEEQRVFFIAEPSLWPPTLFYKRRRPSLSLDLAYSARLSSRGPFVSATPVATVQLLVSMNFLSVEIF